MTSKMAAVQALRAVRALEESWHLDVEQACGAEKLAIYMALNHGLTKNQIFKILKAGMNEDEARNADDNLGRVWKHAFKG